MLSLEDEIEVYTERSFNPEVAAQTFFASYSENEISKRLNDMTILQGSIEEILKQKVRSNYKSFLESNRQIQRLGKDINNLQLLVVNTKKLIEDVKSARIIEAKSIKNNISNNELNDKLSLELINNQIQSDNSKLPDWIRSAPQDIIRYTIEQQYSQSVGIIVKVKTFIDNMKGAIITTPGSEYHNIIKTIDELASNLAKIINSSIDQLPPSNLWGKDEQNMRFSLLIALGFHYIAAEGFARNQIDVAKKVFRSIESTGDSILYITKSSQLFFTTLCDCCQSFLNLFNSFKDDSKVMTQLFDWSLAQITSFITIISKQIDLGVNELSAITLLQLKNAMNTMESPEVKLPQKAYMRLSINTSDVNVDDIIDKDSVINQKSLVLSKGDISTGALTYSSTCFDRIFQESSTLDRIGLQGVSLVNQLLLPEVNKVILSYTDVVIKEIVSQVKQESWHEMKLKLYKIQKQSSDDSDSVSFGVGLSYHLLVTALNHFIDEIITLLRFDQSVQSHYTRFHVCEAEGTAVSSILRIILKYVIEIESIDRQIFNSNQLTCYVNTLKVISSTLLPSLTLRLKECKFIEVINGNKGYHTIDEVIQSINMKTQQILKEIETIK